MRRYRFFNTPAVAALNSVMTFSPRFHAETPQQPAIPYTRKYYNFEFEFQNQITFEKFDALPEEVKKSVNSTLAYRYCRSLVNAKDITIEELCVIPEYFREELRRQFDYESGAQYGSEFERCEKEIDSIIAEIKRHLKKISLNDNQSSSVESDGPKSDIFSKSTNQKDNNGKIHYEPNEFVIEPKGPKM